MDLKKIEELAAASGFDHCHLLRADTIVLRPEVRESCADNSCGRYDACWSCPPACGTLDECTEKIQKFNDGVLLQCTQELEDSFDVEGMQELEGRHKRALNAFTDKIRALYPDCLILGAGSCTRCAKCSYPDEPCRFPEKMISSMEAYGMVVSDVCKANDLPYYYGPNTLTYTACALIE